MITPLLRTPNKNGGTLYTFASASRDLTRAMTNNDYVFRFSHFACLNLPYIYNTITGSDSGNGICLSSLGYGDVADTSEGLNNALTEHLQNYVMNFETLILNGGGDNDNYDFDILRSVSERVFFKWLKSVGGISFDYVNNGYVYEQDIYGDNYNAAQRTVPYIGNIDIINSVEINGDAYNEIYIYIPSGDGATEDIHFQKISDDNYTNMHEYNTSNMHIIGREDGGDTPFGLSTKALYDIKNAEEGYIGYLADSGYCIDFNESHYVKSITDMNAGSGDNFEFNAILIYYDFTYGDKTVTNLYGILFLEEVTDAGGLDLVVGNPMGGIQKYPKIKENSQKNGNSFAFKVDIKIDTMPYTTYKGVEDDLIVYDEINTIDEFQMFTKVMERVQEVIDTFYTQQNTIMALNSRLALVEGLLNSVDSVNNLTSRVSNIESKISDYGIGDAAVIKSLIEENTDIISSIVGGNLPSEFQYNTDVINSDGYGVEVIKNEDSKTITINSNPNYNVRAVSDVDGGSINSSNPLAVGVYDELNSSDCHVILGECANLAVVYTDDDICNNILNVYVDDTSCAWKKGQTMRIYFRSGDRNYISIGDTGIIKIHTGNGEKGYVKSISVNSGDVRSVEMICINDIDLDFVNEVK